MSETKQSTLDETTKRTRIKTPPLVIIFIVVALPCLIIDQVTKALVVAAFEAHVPHPVLGSYLSIEVVRNPGAAFSLAEGLNWLFVIIAFIVLAWIAWTGRRTTRRAWQLSFGLIAGGAAGNLVDRLIQPPSIGRGHVIDFINYNGYFVGNIADVFIVVGVFLVVILTLAGGSPVIKDDTQ
ncbi:MAG: signal peptidase II [Actinomycetaceae bacterium]|nr:signal peptidase II [Actinomycetaceae bacterium]